MAAANALIALPNIEDADTQSRVEAQLARICQSELFRDTSRLKRFLKYVVSEAIEGRADRLKGYSIGIEVFDRPDDFDPQADTIVRVQAGQLRRRLDLYYAKFGQDDDIRILVPKGRYAPTFEFRENIETISDISENQMEKTSQHLIHAHRNVQQIEPYTRPAIAVLTFKNLTENADQDFFAEGITAEIVNALVQFRYLRVVANTATVFEGEESPTLSAITEKYDVQFVLSGSIRRVKNMIRVSVNLISTQTGDHVYAKIFDRDCSPENLFEIQENIASYVAASVGAPFGAVNRFNRRHVLRNLDDISAYEAVLKYYGMTLTPTDEKALKLLAAIEDVNARKPRFSTAWAIRSLLEAFLVTQVIPPHDPVTRLDKALRAANRAVAIDPENATAYQALFVANFHSGKIAAYEKAAARAIVLNPNDYNVLAYHAILQAFLGQCDSACALYEAAIALNPCPPKWFQISRALLFLQEKEYAKLLPLVEETGVTSSAVLQAIALAVLGHLGETDRAKVILDRYEMSPPAMWDIVHQISKVWHTNPELAEIMLQGWIRAGLTELD